MEIVNLGSVVDCFDSEREPLSTMERSHRKGIYPYYGANGPIDFIDDFAYEGEYILLAEDGSVRTKDGHPVLALTKPAERFWVSNHAHVLRPKRGIETRYLYYVLSSANADSIVTGAVQPKISQANLFKLKVIIHSREEQRHIVDATRRPTHANEAQ